MPTSPDGSKQDGIDHGIPRGSAASVLAVPPSDASISMSGITSGHFPSQETGDPSTISPTRRIKFPVTESVTPPPVGPVVAPVDAIAGKRQKVNTPSVMSLDFGNAFAGTP